MRLSARFGVSYPSADRSDAPDVATHISNVVVGLEQAAMYGQGPIASRPVSTGGTPGIQGRLYASTDETPQRLYYDYGTGWFQIGVVPALGVGTAELAANAVTQAKLAANSVGTAQIITGSVEGHQVNWHVGTSPPGSPADGDIWVFPVDATNGFNWMFRYNAGSASTYKWEFIGGPPFITNVAAAETTSSATYVDLTTVGPSVTLARDGDYIFRFGYNGGTTTVSSGMAAKVATAVGGSTDTEAAMLDMSDSTGGSAPKLTGASHANKQAAVGAASTWKMVYRSSGATWTIRDRWMSTIPIRVI